ncbi:hypothetical protein NL676_022109 [Syzygium grande]|nr:hypothetical protein NL676_022109 [Syzygium grande]
MLPFVLLALLPSLIPSLAAAASHRSSPASSAPSIYDVLRSHGLPMGLLPKGVTGFRIDAGGQFEAYLDRACNAKFESELHYDRNVSGTLSYGQIGALSGISAQELFLWFPVKGIRVDIPSSGLIYFDVGVVSKQFSLSLFETPPDCTAARAEEMGGFRDGELIAQAVSKGQSGKLRYRLDQGHFAREVL